MLPGAKISRVFTSRWKALYWSAGVLLLAYCSIPAAEEPQGPPEPHAKQAKPAKPYDKWNPKNRTAPATIHRQPADKFTKAQDELSRLNQP